MNKQEKKKCYISGKITELPNEVATKNFREASLYAQFLGYEPINPMEIIPNGDEPKSEKEKWSWYMKADLKEMMDCDAILMQNNWKDSKGAIVEHNLAKDLGLAIMHIGRHRNTEIELSKKYNRDEIFSNEKDDKKIFKFLSVLICLIIFLYFNFNYLIPYLLK